MKKNKFIFIDSEWHTPNTYDSNFKYPTNNSGVYLITESTPNFKLRKTEYDILYVGSAKDLNVRYNKHEVLRLLKQIYSNIQFFFKEEPNYREVEKGLIKLIQPKFNKQWR